MVSSELKGNSLRTNWGGTKIKLRGPPISVEGLPLSLVHTRLYFFYFLVVKVLQMCPHPPGFIFLRGSFGAGFPAITYLRIKCDKKCRDPGLTPDTMKQDVRGEWQP